MIKHGHSKLKKVLYSIYHMFVKKYAIYLEYEYFVCVW